MIENPPEIQERVPLVPPKGQVWRNFFRHAATALGVLIVSGLVCGGLYEWVRPTLITPFRTVTDSIKYFPEYLFYDQFIILLFFSIVALAASVITAYRKRYQKYISWKTCRLLAVFAVVSTMIFLFWFLWAMNEKNYTQLHLASEFGYANRARLLVWLGADVNARNDNGHQPLDLAIWNRHADIARLLISHGGTRRSDSCYYYAFISYDPSVLPIVDLFIEQIDNINYMFPIYNMTALHVAANIGNTTLVEYLLQKGADIESRTEKLRTPLHEAVDHLEIGKVEGMQCVKFLLDHGADVNAVDEQGQRPLDIARYEELRQLLRDHGGLTSQELANKENR